MITAEKQSAQMQAMDMLKKLLETKKDGDVFGFWFQTNRPDIAGIVHCHFEDERTARHPRIQDKANFFARLVALAAGTEFSPAWRHNMDEISELVQPGEAWGIKNQYHFYTPED